MNDFKQIHQWYIATNTGARDEYTGWRVDDNTIYIMHKYHVERHRFRMIGGALKNHYHNRRIMIWKRQSDTVRPAGWSKSYFDYKGEKDCTVRFEDVI